MFTRRSERKRAVVFAAVMAVVGIRAAVADDYSPPPILQDFESGWTNNTARMPDIFAAGYGSVYTPPPGRAQTGSTSVGYDPYDRFDFGSAGNPTLYGTAAGLKQMVSAIHAMGGNSIIDLVWNHSGFADTATSGFAQAGGYPGFALTLQTTNSSAPGYNTKGYNAVDGDYHGAYATGDQQERLAGLVDIAQESQNYFVRQPTVAGPNNIPGPTPGASGYGNLGLANVPDPANAQFYPDPTTTARTYTITDNNLAALNMATTVAVTVHSFNASNPTAGVPTSEDALGYLQRYAQYMVQVVGVDGFRVDAAKNMPPATLDLLDASTYQASNRYLLNGQQENIFSFSEVFDGNQSLLQSYVNKNISSASQVYQAVGGNRDVYDFPLLFAMQNNLSSVTSNNSWGSVVSASFDLHDDGLLNGSQGVKFVQSQDSAAPALSNVAYAYTLMLPGNAMVYYNAHQFGTAAQRSFPADGRGDALGGMYGPTITTLVDLRARYGRGNYRQDFLDADNHEYAFERTGSSLVLLSNINEAGYDSRTIDVTFAPGTPLIELTGNAHGTSSDPGGNIPQLLVVNADTASPTGSSVNARFLRNSFTNSSGGSVYSGDGYLIYGLASPQGTLSLNGTSGKFGGVTGKSSDSNAAYENATQLVSNVLVVKGSTFTVNLNTVAVNLLGYYRDHDADGDNAILKVDGGVDVSGSGVDTNPADTVSYGFGQFVTTRSPGYYANSNAGGAGTYSQVINTARLGQGYHYITVEAFRHGGSQGIYTDWKQTIYVDTAPPNSAAVSFDPIVAGTNENRNLNVQSVDGLANNVHTFLDLPYGLTDAQVLAIIGSSTQANNLDVNLWQHAYNSVTSGNHTATVVTYKPDGTYAVQRFNSTQLPGLSVSTYFGAGVGDLNFDGQFNGTDVSTLSTIVQTNNSQFNPAADVNGDGLVNLSDVFLMGPVLTAHNATSATLGTYNTLVHSSYVISHTYTVSGTNVIYDDTAAATVVPAGASLAATSIRGQSLSIAGGATVTIAPNATPANSVGKVGSLVVNPAGKLDLTNGSFVVEPPTAGRSAVYANLVALVTEGSDHGAWDGLGITSSTAAADTLHLTAVAVVLNDNGFGVPLTSSFHGQTVDTNAVLIGYTYLGDANLDGVVDGSDYSLVDSGFLTHSTGWQAGDFNYDGVVDGSDFTLMDNSFNRQSSPMPTLLVAFPTAEAAPVPEPASILIALAGGLAARRRSSKGTRHA